MGSTCCINYCCIVSGQASVEVEKQVEVNGRVVAMASSHERSDFVAVQLIDGSVMKLSVGKLH